MEDAENAYITNMPKFVLCLILFVSLFIPPHSYAEGVRVVSNTLPPLKFVQNGEPTGIMVDVLSAILKRMGEPFDASEIQTMAWARAYEDAMFMPGTILLSIAKTKERTPIFKWVGPVYRIQLGLIGKKNKPYRIDKAADAAEYTVGTLLNTAPEQLLFKQGFPSERAHRIPKTEQALKMLSEGRIDLFAHTADSSFYMMKSMGIDPSKFSVYYTIRDVDLYIGLNNSFSEEFAGKMQAIFEELKKPGPDGVSEYDRIIAKYLQ